MVMRQTNPSGAAPAGLTEPDYGEAKTRILLTAERLFAEHGYSGASLRAIMAEAGVNTAAIHYYFRNKEGLLRAIFEMRVSSMNAERAERLGAIEAATSAGDTRPEISAVLRAFIEPAVRRSREPSGQAFNRISALCSVDPSPVVRQVVFDSYDVIARRFTALLRLACPHLSNEEFFWRQHFIYGSMMYLRTNNGRVSYLLGEQGRNDSDAAVEQLLIFLTAGMSARGDTSVTPE
jgi:AcrR family transcriptional regulator